MCVDETEGGGSAFCSVGCVCSDVTERWRTLQYRLWSPEETYAKEGNKNKAVRWRFIKLIDFFFFCKMFATKNRASDELRVRSIPFGHVLHYCAFFLLKKINKDPLSASKTAHHKRLLQSQQCQTASFYWGWHNSAKSFNCRRFAPINYVAKQIKQNDQKHPPFNTHSHTKKMKTSCICLNVL